MGEKWTNKNDWKDLRNERRDMTKIFQLKLQCLRFKINAEHFWHLRNPVHSTFIDNY